VNDELHKKFLLPFDNPGLGFPNTPPRKPHHLKILHGDREDWNKPVPEMREPRTAGTALGCLFQHTSSKDAGSQGVHTKDWVSPVGLGQGTPGSRSQTTQALTMCHVFKCCKENHKIEARVMAMIDDPVPQPISKTRAPPKRQRAKSVEPWTNAGFLPATWVHRDNRSPYPQARADPTRDGNLAPMQNSFVVESTVQEITGGRVAAISKSQYRRQFTWLDA
jgi:hypothetical protein